MIVSLLIFTCLVGTSLGASIVLYGILQRNLKYIIISGFVMFVSILLLVMLTKEGFL